MRSFVRVLTPLILALSLLAAVSSAALGRSQETTRFIIANVDTDTQGEIKASMEGRRVGPGVFAATADAPRMNELKARRPHLRIEPDLPMQASELSNDPCVTSCNGTSQWYLSSIRSSEAWGVSKGDGIIIAVLDTGVDANHPDLVGKMEASVDVTTALDGPGAHGTAVAGIAAASTNNALGIAGMGWNSRILSIKVLDSLGSGLTSAIINGIYEAVFRGAKVINLSLTGSASQSLKDAVDHAVNSGVVVVAAAGNQGVSTPSYPAAYPNVLSVGAVGADGRKASFSNYGNWVDLYAPGVNLYTTSIGTSPYAHFTGTSAAAPVVAGAAALMIARGVHATPSAVESQMIQSGAGVTDTSNWRRLDAGAALGVMPAPQIVGTIARSLSPYPGFAGGVNIAYGDVDGDGKDEIITGAGPGGGPHVLAFKQNGSVVASFFAYDPGFTGGVSVSAGDQNLDGKDDMITGAGRGGGPHVRVFSGGSGQELEGFLAFSSFFGGVDVAGSKGSVGVSMLRQGSAVIQQT